jgi:hypothetical protein
MKVEVDDGKERRLSGEEEGVFIVVGPRLVIATTTT